MFCKVFPKGFRERATKVILAPRKVAIWKMVLLYLLLSWFLQNNVYIIAILKIYKPCGRTIVKEWFFAKKNYLNGIYKYSLITNWDWLTRNYFLGTRGFLFPQNFHNQCLRDCVSASFLMTDWHSSDDNFWKKRSVFLKSK